MKALTTKLAFVCLAYASNHMIMSLQIVVSLASKYIQKHVARRKFGILSLVRDAISDRATYPEPWLSPVRDGITNTGKNLAIEF